MTTPFTDAEHISMLYQVIDDLVKQRNDGESTLATLRAECDDRDKWATTVRYELDRAGLLDVPFIDVIIELQSLRRLEPIVRRARKIEQLMGVSPFPSLGPMTLDAIHDLDKLRAKP